MKVRNASIDVFKGLLVIGMIFSHTIDVFADRNSFFIPRQITTFSACITFSGFLFCFGYVNKTAYLSKNFTDVWKKLFSNVRKTYFAYLISGLFYALFVEKMELTIRNIVKVALFFKLPILSEFIIAFSLFSMFTLIAFKPLKWIVSNKKVFWVTCAALLLTTFIPPDFATTNQVGLLIGSNKFGSFPLLQYMPLYLLGMYFAEYKIIFNMKLFIGAIICTLVPFSFYIITGALPSRFPPELLWITAPLLFLYGYYLAAQHIRIDVLEFMGRNVLFYVLLSNLIIFSMKAAINFSLYPDPFAVKSLLTAFILAILITYLAKMPVRSS